MKKKILLGCLIVMSVGLLQAQKEQFVSVYAGGGLHNINSDYSSVLNDSKARLGYDIGLGYSYFVTKNWGVSSGIGLQHYEGSSEFNFQTVSNRTDIAGDNYEFRAKFAGWKERQTVTYIYFPIMAQYQLDLFPKTKMLAGAGFDIAIPVSSHYSTTDGTIATSGYYSQWNVELTDLPQYGFGTILPKYSGNTSLKTVSFLSLNLGIQRALKPKISLYSGVYCKMGLWNIQKNSSGSIIDPSGVYTSALGTGAVKNIRPVAFGVKFGVNFSLDKGEKKPDDVK